MDAEAALRMLSDIRGEVGAASDSVLNLAEQGLADLAALRRGELAAIERIEAGLCALLEACAFGDIVTQQLGQLHDALAPTTAARDPLLNGPARAGNGIDQAAADLLLATPPAPPRP